MNEFELIERCFGNWTTRNPGLRLGQGDDCLIWQDPTPMAMSIDTAVVGRHFPENATAEQVAQRAFLPALSDLAAMGAEPVFFTLAITLPAPLDSDWLFAFSHRLRQLAEHWNMVLAGGDTTSGPCTVVSIQVHGKAPNALLRSGARPGDDLWVSGRVGLASAALPAVLAPDRHTVPQAWLDAYWQPTPRIELGRRLRGLASACIDVSDGLAADVGHIAQASRVRIDLNADQVPTDPELGHRLGEQALSRLLSGGDDYELAFTTPREKRATITALAESMAVPLTRIGQVSAGDAELVIRHNGQPMALGHQGFQHF